MDIRRKDPYLSEAVELLDRKIEDAQGNVYDAYSRLSSFETSFIDEEIEKCLDFRYYAENYHTISSKHDGFITLYPFWDSQEIFYEKILEIQIAGRPVKIIVLKARQLGLSTIGEALIFHRTIFTEGCNSLVVAQNPEQADYLFNMCRFAYDWLPWWMRPEARYESKGRYLHFDRKDDTLRRVNPGLQSAIFVEAANKMSGVSVGKALNTFHASELSLWPDAKVLAEQLFPTLSGTASQIAIMESTARGRNNFWHDFWKEAWDGKVDWTPVFIEFFRVKKYSLPIPVDTKFQRTKDEELLRVKVLEDKGVALTDEQLYWRRKTMQEFAALNRGDDSMFFQEFPGASYQESFQGSGVCAFNKKRLQTILETTCHPPKWYGEIYLDSDKYEKKVPFPRLIELKKGQIPPPRENPGARLYVWEQPEPGETYVIGGDVAHGVYGGDYSVAQVIKVGQGPHPDVQVAEWHGWINPTPFGDVLVALGYWYNTAMLSIECNDVGQTTNARVMRVLEYPNLFRWKHYDKIKNFITDFFGWYTNVKTRDSIIAKFREYLDDEMIVVRSEALIDECFDFSSVDDSRFEGQSSHDDLVMSMMICVFCAHDAEGWGTDNSAKPAKQEGVEVLCICGHTKDLHRGNCTEKDCPCRFWCQAVDFVNTDFSPTHDADRKRDYHPNENPPEDYSMWEETSVGQDDEKWKLL